MSRVNVRLPQPPAQYDKAHMNRLVNTLELQLSADSTTLAEVADVLGTLITDLKAKGVIS